MSAEVHTRVDVVSARSITLPNDLLKRLDDILADLRDIAGSIGESYVCRDKLLPDGRISKVILAIVHPDGHSGARWVPVQEHLKALRNI